ncbi:short subunit dehydrogenase [Rhodobacter sp. JA431]|uniref:SDR family NAD(P)-dependent oxidoreductase n=1 Tax=Rhodobacter sp. JA431 TaxID=570013 RepID=UPI000BC8E5A9|nr:SDR family NAD(P)-dependent oxidoreductase [Rhodobacter sp. JA431]SOC04269.1 short subunit dehydrogenase [Rhodobacter sp. JA431]
MELGLRGKTALVLSGGGGLGSAIARGLAAEGARVAVANRSIDAAEINASGGGALALDWDLADLSAIEPAVLEIAATFGPVDILIANTGGPPPGPAES